MSDAASESGGDSSPTVTRSYGFASNIIFFVIVGVAVYSCNKIKEHNVRTAIEEKAQAQKRRDQKTLKGHYPDLLANLEKLSEGIRSSNDKLKAEAFTRTRAYITSLAPVRFRFKASIVSVGSGSVRIDWSETVFLPEFNFVDTANLVEIAGERVWGSMNFGGFNYTTKDFPSVWENLSKGDPIMVEATVQLEMQDTLLETPPANAPVSNPAMRRDEKRPILMTLSDLTLSSAKKESTH